MFLTSINRREELTGLDFLSKIDDPLADIIEAKYEELSEAEKKAVVARWME